MSQRWRRARLAKCCSFTQTRRCAFPKASIDPFDRQTSSESWFLDLTDPEGRVRLVQKRKQNVLYHPCELVALVSLSVLPSVKVGELFHVRELPNWLG